MQENSYNQQRFKALSDASFEAIFIIKEGYIIETNKTVFHIFGYEKSELDGKFASIIIAPESREDAKEKMLTGYEEHYKSIGIRKDNTRINIEIRGKMIYYRGEEVRVTAIRDITKRTKIEIALKQSEANYRQVVSSISPVIWKAEFDKNNKRYKAYVSPVAEEMLGLPPNTIKHNWDNFFSYVLKVDVKKLVKQAIWVRKNLDKNFKLEYRILRADGKIIWVNTQGKGTKDKAGNIIVFGTIEDITDRKQMEQSVIESEKKYRTLFDATPDPILIHKKGIILKVNKACLKFVEAKNISQILNLSINKFIKEYTNEELVEKINKVEESKITKFIEEKFVTLSGIVKDVEVVAVPIIYEKEKAIQVIFRDITEQKKALTELQNSEKQLFQLNATKDKFFSIIAHDLRNPFNQLLGLTDLILENYQDYSFSDLKEYIGLLNKSAKNGYNLLENLLEWARSQSGRKEINPFNFELIHVSKKVVELMQANATNKNIQIISKISKDISIFADVNVINTILINLISNSIKFTKSGGEIIVDAINNGNHVIISVKDNGLGISQDNINKLFKIDIHHSTKGTNNEAGTGLGLILCYEFINLSKGKIWVESEFGHGSTFYFSLPKSNNKLIINN